MTNLEIRFYGPREEGSFRVDDFSFLQSAQKGFSIPLLVHAINHSRKVRDYAGMAREVLARRVGLMTQAQITSLYGADIEVDPARINFVMVENEGAERIPLSRWIILHRLKHAYAFITPVPGVDHKVPFVVRKLEQECITENGMKGLVCRSGREKLLSGNDEFFPEVFASWLLKGTLGEFSSQWVSRLETAYTNLVDWSVGKVVVL